MAPRWCQIHQQNRTDPNLHNFTKTNAALSAHKPKRSWGLRRALSIAFYWSITTSIKWRHCNQIHKLSTKQSLKSTNYTPRCRSPGTNARLKSHLNRNNLRLLSWTLATSIGSESQNALNQRLETSRIPKTTLPFSANATTKQHESTCTLVNACQHQHWDGHIQPEFKESQETKPNRAPKITNPTVILHAHTSTTMPQRWFSKAYLLRDAVRVRMGKLKSFRGCRKKRCSRYP